MGRLTSRIIWAVMFGSLLVGSCIAQARIRVNESAIRIQFRFDGSLVVLSLENQTGEKIDSHVLLELVDPRGVVQVHSDQAVSIPIGSTTLRLALPSAFTQNANPGLKNLLWYRLRYTIKADPPNKQIPEPAAEYSRLEKLPQGSSNCMWRVQPSSGKVATTRLVFEQFIR
jgi:hypothetical protein